MLRLKRLTSEKRIVTSAVVLLVLIFDQSSKYFASNFLEISCNKGFAFGIGSNATLATLIVIVLVFWILTQEKRFLPSFGLSLIFAGGISNIVDRVSYGCVRDFISIGNFPSFNLADSAIAIGALIIVMDIFKKRK